MPNAPTLLEERVQINENSTCNGSGAVGTTVDLQTGIDTLTVTGGTTITANGGVVNTENVIIDASNEVSTNGATPAIRGENGNALNVTNNGTITDTFSGGVQNTNGNLSVNNTGTINTTGVAINENNGNATIPIAIRSQGLQGASQS